jgi:hypothetical protein
MVRISGHHVFNLIWAYGMGKEHLGEETNAFTNVFRKVMRNPSVTVKVVVGIDDICTPCKENNNGRCLAYDGTIFDIKAIDKLGLETGEMKHWNDLVKLVTDLVKGEKDFMDIFSQKTLESRYSFFKHGIEKLSIDDPY